MTQNSKVYIASPYNFPRCNELSVCICVAVDAESVLYGVRGNQEIDLDELTFKLIVRSRDKPDSGTPYTVTLMAPSAQEKAAWTSDISQVIFLCQLFTSYQSELNSWHEEKEALDTHDLIGSILGLRFSVTQRRFRYRKYRRVISA